MAIPENKSKNFAPLRNALRSLREKPTSPTYPLLIISQNKTSLFQITVFLQFIF